VSEENVTQQPNSALHFPRTDFQLTSVGLKMSPQVSDRAVGASAVSIIALVSPVRCVTALQ
jgi:hypothetical protein